MTFACRIYRNIARNCETKIGEVFWKHPKPGGRKRTGENSCYCRARRLERPFFSFSKIHKAFDYLSVWNRTEWNTEPTCLSALIFANKVGRELIKIIFAIQFPWWTELLWTSSHICLSKSLSVCLSRLYVYLSIRPSIHPSTYIIYLSIYPSIR